MSAVNVGLVCVAVVLFAGIESVTSRVAVENGRGWDGSDYVDMLESGFDEGTANTALRPLVVLMNRPAYLLTRDAVTAFRLMNYVYVGLLCLALCLLADQYGADTAAKGLLVGNVFMSIAAAKYFAYYPVLIDAGAYAVQALGLYFIITGRRLAAAVTCLAAVLSREFAIAVVVFGVCRELRLRTGVWRVAFTYGPAVLAYFAWRAIVQAEFAARGALLTVPALAANLTLWRDPVFASLFLYFLVTIYGGVSLLVFARPADAVRFLRREFEWPLYAALVVAAAVVGSADIWRYQAYILPLVAVLFVQQLRLMASPALRWASALVVCAATVVTQRPWQHIDLGSYFRDWFPYYVQLARVPTEAPRLPLWPLWGWRFLTAALLLSLLAALPFLVPPTTNAHRA